MTLEEKIGQLFVIPVCPTRTDGHLIDLLNLFETYKIGNVLLKQSDPITQVKFLNQLQSASKLPLLVLADAEWGLAMRMSNTIAYPRNMTLGAIQDLSLIIDLGKEIARQAKLVGIHMNLAPVADVNNNPLNPIIHMRSFGEDPNRVGVYVSAITFGMRMGGIFACAKHFPGHGDTSVDSHQDLPVIAHSKQRLEAVEYVPFQRVVDEGIEALMTAHLYIPALDERLPTSLSSACLNVARNLLQFKGVLISDALNMKAIADRYLPEQIACLARIAGCDLLLYGDHVSERVDQILQEIVPKAFLALKEGYVSGRLSMGELDRTVLKILVMKEKIDTKIPLDGLMESLHSKAAIELKEKLFQHAVTLVGEECFPIPKDTACLTFGSGDVLASEFLISPEKAEKIVIAIHERQAIPDALAAIKRYKENAIVCLFTTHYALSELGEVKTVLVGYENDTYAQKAVLDVLLGKRKAIGKLPVNPTTLSDHPR